MINRYSYTNISKNSANKRIFNSTLYPILERSENDIYIQSRRGDRLDKYALEYYGDSRYWWVIALVNQIGRGSIVVPSQMQIRIPMNVSELETLMKELNN